MSRSPCRNSGLLVPLLGLVWMALPATAQDEQFREREVLDAETDAWVEQAAPATGPADELARARGLLAEGKSREAGKLLEKWLEENYDHERYFEAELLLGECHFERGDYWKAAERFEDIADNASGELFYRANRRVVDVALAFLSGKRRIVWKILYIPAYEDGIELLDRVWERVPGTRLGELALWIKANYYYQRGELDLAQDEYANIVQQYPAGRFLQLAMLRSAEASEAAFPGVKYDAQTLLNAADRYEQVLEQFPAFAEREQLPQRLEGIREKQAQKDIEVARWYERWRRPDAAEFYYRLVIEEWSDTLAAAEARTRLLALGVAIEEPGEMESNSP